MLLSLPLSTLSARLPTDAPFTRRTAREAGVSDDTLRRWMLAGTIRRIVRGVYVASSVPDSIELRCQALGLIVPDDSFVCDRTAAWLYRGNGALAPNEHLAVPEISIFRPSDHRARRGPLTLSGERAVSAEDVRDLGAVRATTPLRTALDLGRLQRSADLRLWGMDNMLMTEEFELEELLEQVPRFKGQRGVVGLRALAPLAQHGSQSFGESALRRRWYDAGLPRPILQHRVVLDDGAERFLDLAHPGWLFAAEYDGAEWHSSSDQQSNDTDRRERISTQHGWSIEVFTAANVFGQFQDASVLLRRAAVQARSTVGIRRWHL